MPLSTDSAKLYFCKLDLQPHERNTHGEGYGSCNVPVSVWQPQVGDFIAEHLVHDVRVYVVTKITAQTIRVQRCKMGRIVKSENRDGNPWPCTYHEAERDSDAPIRTLRRRKDGTFRVADWANPLRPATVVEGVPCFFTDYRE